MTRLTVLRCGYALRRIGVRSRFRTRAPQSAILDSLVKLDLERP